ELLPRQICCDLHDIRRRDKRHFRVTTINRPTHAAHECGYFVAGPKFSSGGCNDLTHALNSADLSCLTPLAFTHVGFGVTYAARFLRDQVTPSFWLSIRQFRDDHTFKPTKTVQNICTHLYPSRARPRIACFQLAPSPHAPGAGSRVTPPRTVTSRI